mmetsp:Transcript_7130/g.17890  ORF Transcript_7130/g.17890 Transcript_7130/m.17890 type:complete len:386 (-) Transcript_7130:499-1656(-)
MHPSAGTAARASPAARATCKAGGGCERTPAPKAARRRACWRRAAGRVVYPCRGPGAAARRTRTPTSPRGGALHCRRGGRRRNVRAAVACASAVARRPAAPLGPSFVQLNSVRSNPSDGAQGEVLRRSGDPQMPPTGDALGTGLLERTGDDGSRPRAKGNGGAMAASFVMPQSTQFQRPDCALTVSIAVLKSGRSACAFSFCCRCCRAASSSFAGRRASSCSLACAAASRSLASSASAKKYSSSVMRPEAKPSFAAEPSTTVRRLSSQTKSSNAKSFKPWASRLKAVAEPAAMILQASFRQAFHLPRRTTPTEGPTQWMKMCLVMGGTNRRATTPRAAAARSLHPKERRKMPKRTRSGSKAAFISSTPPKPAAYSSSLLGSSSAQL